MNRLVLVLVTGLLGCAASSGPDPRQIALAKHEAAAQVYSDDVAQVGAFRQRADVLASECNLLRGHPGWDDMARLLNSSASIEYIEGKEAATWKTRAMLAAWSRRWDASADQFLAQYKALVGSGNTMEQERFRLLAATKKHQDEWKTVKANMLVQAALAARPEATDAILGGIDTAKQRVDEAYAPLGYVLARYGRDDMGLYRVGAPALTP
jgi:hypothetical protein